jgi:hypothetical protein
LSIASLPAERHDFFVARLPVDTGQVWFTPVLPVSFWFICFQSSSLQLVVSNLYFRVGVKAIEKNRSSLHGSADRPGIVFLPDLFFWHVDCTIKFARTQLTWQSFKGGLALRRVFLFHLEIPPENDEVKEDQPGNTQYEQLAQHSQHACSAKPPPFRPGKGLHVICIVTLLILFS